MARIATAISGRIQSRLDCHRNQLDTDVHADHLGTPRAITRPSDNQVMWKWDNTDPYGANLPNENPSGLGQFVFNLRFPGQQYDAETGTHYNGFRDYDPRTGYIQSDPIGLQGGISTYGYVGGSPLLWTDVNGLAPGGPYHPPKGVSVGCTGADTCPQLKAKMQQIERMLESHEGWDKVMPPPRGGGRHGQEIEELYRAYAKCIKLWDKKCKECPPEEENGFSKWWKWLTLPRPISDPEPDPLNLDTDGKKPNNNGPFIFPGGRRFRPGL